MRARAIQVQYAPRPSTVSRQPLATSGRCVLPAAVKHRNARSTHARKRARQIGSAEGHPPKDTCSSCSARRTKTQPTDKEKKLSRAQVRRVNELLRPTLIDSENLIDAVKIFWNICHSIVLLR